MDHFTLEAVPARYGDCLLLHFGSTAKPGLILIDGGPSKVYGKFLEPRLESLRQSRGSELKIDLLMISHIDDDHVLGIADFTRAWRTALGDGEDWPYPVRDVWHNSFERVSDATTLDAVTASVLASTGSDSIDEIDLEEQGIAPDGERLAALKVLASVGNGKKVRDDFKALKDLTGLGINRGFDGLVKPGDGPDVPYKLGDTLTLHLVAPLADQLTALRKMFAKELPKGAKAALAAYSDGSVPNLSSIAAVAAYKGKTMLLTGDARGDYLLDGLKQEGFLDAAGKVHVDILKLPHHGSDRNVEQAFFGDVTADHYIASADGTFGNPDRATMEMLIGARAKADAYTIHLTYPLAEIDARRKDEWEKDRAGEQKKKDTVKPSQIVRRAWDNEKDDLTALFKAKQAQGHAFKVSAPATAGPGARVDLLGPLPA